MATAASIILDRAETILQDTGNDRWSEAELLDWLNEAQRQVILYKPDANAIIEALSLDAGSKNDLPTGATQLLDVTYNLGTGGTSGTELIAAKVDRDFSAASGWTNGDVNAYNETGDLTLTASAADQYCTLPAANAPMTSGKLYKLEVTVANLTSTSFSIADEDNTQTLCTHVVTGDNEISFVYSGTCDGGLRIIATGDSSTADFDDFSLKEPPVGDAITVVDRGMMDAAYPGWRDIAAAATVKHVIYDPVKLPKKFWVYPKSDGTNYIEIIYSKLPTDCSAKTSNIGIADEYVPVLLDWILMRAFQKDAEYNENMDRVLQHFDSFQMALGVREQAEDRFAPRRAQRGLA